MARTFLRCTLLSLVTILSLVPGLRAQDAPTAILQVLSDQQNAWNKADIVTFMHGYADSPDTTFIGKTMEKGYAGIFARYKRSYDSHAAMGTLEFSGLSVRMLGTDHAVVTGHFHLTRTPAGGGDAQGIFSLIFEKQDAGWKIILDHTSTS